MNMIFKLCDHRKTLNNGSSESEHTGMLIVQMLIRRLDREVSSNSV